MATTLDVSNDLLRKATELRMSECFPAMQIANAIGGSPTPTWEVANKYTLTDLIEECLDRGLPIDEFRSAVDHARFVDCRWYLRVRDEIGGRPDFPR